MRPTRWDDGFGINTPKLLNASHVIVFATRQNLTNEYLAELHAKEIADGKFPSEELAEQWKGSFVAGWISIVDECNWRFIANCTIFIAVDLKIGLMATYAWRFIEERIKLLFSRGSV